MSNRICLGSLLLLAACQLEEAPRPVPAPAEIEFTTELATNGEMVAQPIATLKVRPGVIAKFYVWEDLSGGYLLEADSDSKVPPHGELDGMSMAEAFYSLSTADTPIPEALLMHHQALVADGDRPPWTEVVARPRGWMLERPVISSLAECNNTTFRQNSCTAFVGSASCHTDVAGNLSIDAFGQSDGGTKYFTAAFCIDGGGQTFDSLNYENRCDGTAGIIWLGYHGSPTYGTWTWIAPSGASPIRWRHVGVGSGGAVRDWATRWWPFQSC